jgi:hypothetical protein
MMEATNTSETSVNFYQSTRRYNPEDSQLHPRLREKLKSRIMRGNGSQKNNRYNEYEMDLTGSK